MAPSGTTVSPNPSPFSGLQAVFWQAPGVSLAWRHPTRNLFPRTFAIAAPTPPKQNGLSVSPAVTPRQVHTWRLPEQSPETGGKTGFITSGTGGIGGDS